MPFSNKSLVRESYPYFLGVINVMIYVGINSAPEFFGVDEAFTILDLPNFLVKHAEKHSDYLLYYDLLNNNSLVVQPFITDHIQRYNIKVNNLLLILLRF